MKLDGESPKQDDTDDQVAPETPDKEKCTANSLTVNKRFVVNTLKQVDDHNRIKTNIHSKNLRKFQNEQRKKHTLKNLTKFSAQKTMYSDFCDVSSLGNGKKPKRTNFITPLEQVKKLVTDAAEFDQEHKEVTKKVVRKPPSRVCLDKTLLNNHLKHYSVHNRLKEEGEMWDKHLSSKKNKLVGLQSRSSKLKAQSMISKRSSYGGSMYADREHGNAKVSRVKHTLDNPPRIGNATRELLELEESMPDRWGHNGFKETYEDDIDDLDDILEPDVDRPKKLTSRKVMSSRKIIISNRAAVGRNTSIELSECDDVEIVPSKKARRVVSNIVPNTAKVKTKHRPVVVYESDDTVEDSIIEPKKKSVVTVATKRSNRDTVGLIGNSGKKILNDRTRLGTLQADLILNEEKRNKMVIKRAGSPRWGHDGYREISGGNGEDSDSDQEWEEKKVSSILPENDARRRLKQSKSEGEGLARTTVRNSLHSDKRDSIKSRLILPEQKMNDDEADSSFSDRKISHRKRVHSEDDDSSFTESSSDERYKKKVQLKKMRHKKFHIDQR